jgi:hypothetical protein
MLRLGMPTTVIVDRTASADKSQENDAPPQKTANPVKG